MTTAYTIEVKYSDTQSRKITCVQDVEVFRKILARTHPKAKIVAISKPHQIETSEPSCNL